MRQIYLNTCTDGLYLREETRNDRKQDEPVPPLHPLLLPFFIYLFRARYPTRSNPARLPLSD